MLKIMKASAGSGKTYSLARTYISLLLRNEDRYAYRHILAVTFTNKATDEMKNRILKELHVMATEPFRSSYRGDFVPSVFATDELMQRKAQAVLHDILHDYGAFAVSTIDRFFQQTLKAFSREIGQFASYQVELDRDSLVAESVDRILDSLTEESGSLLSWLTENVLEQIEQGDRYSLDANLLSMAVRLKSSQRQEAMERAGIDEDEAYSKEKLSGIRSRCRKIMADFREEVISCASRALEVLETAGVDPSESNRGFLKALYLYSELDENEPIVAPKESFFTRASDSEQWFAKSKAGRYMPLVHPFLEAPLGEFCDLWDKEFAVYNTACILEDQIYGLGVAGELRKTFQELMKEKNVLCIEDSNTILRDIIDGCDAPFVYEKLGVRFDHFLLDEFQDTAQVQWTNFSPLLHNSDSQGGENLIVGDVKQSIYRWRGSDWKLLDESIPEEFPSHVEEILDTNYRSLAGIVNFNNDFFDFAAKRLDDSAADEYKGALGRIYSDVRQKVAERQKAGGSVRLTFCPKEEELVQVLEAVNQARETGAELSDIAVLVRSNAAGGNVSSFLIDHGIPVITDDSLKVKSSITVRRLVSLMAYADNPDNTVSGYLAESLDVELPDSSSSLVDMAESLIRNLKRNEKDGFRKGEVLHVQSFMDCLQDYVTSNGNNLRGFLKYWEGADPSISSPSSGNSVRVMTIHKSKGLDFPYVILPFAENITMYKPGNLWCSPALEGTGLDGVAEGVYDVTLSGGSESTLFAEHYRNERFLQQVDNMNTLYVAMTRASLGMHIIAKTPSLKFVTAVESGLPVEFTDFSQLLYCFAHETDIPSDEKDGVKCFVVGDMPDFCEYRRKDILYETAFPIEDGMEYPSIALNPVQGEGDVRERGRLKFSADSVDFFSEDGGAGISASNRMKGVVLHDILSKVYGPDDLDQALSDAVRTGEITENEAEQAGMLLKERISQVSDKGWFPEDRGGVMNEVSLMDTDGQVYRPDRVIRRGNTVIIVDYKFGEHHPKYERQLVKYARIWKEIGATEVSAYLWYVADGDIVQVQTS